jgi:hypothetical protein
MRIFLLVDCSGRELHLRLDLDVRRRDVSTAPGGGLPLTSKLLVSYRSVLLTTPRGHWAWASPKFFFSARIADGRLTYVPAYLRSGLPTFRLTYTSLAAQPTWLMFRLTYVPAYLCSGRPTRLQLLNLSGLPPSSSSLLLSISCSSGTSIFLFYVIGLSSFYKIIFLFFLPSLQLKHVM